MSNHAGTNQAEMPSAATPEASREPHFIVGIGASAGGLDPLVRFFDNLPRQTGMAFVIVQHLSPDFRSLMEDWPDMDGMEVARRIRANPRNAGVRLIALTGYGRTRDRLETSLAGFDHHRVKPVQPEELLALMAQFGSSPSDVGT